MASPIIKKVSLTGSVEVGKQILKLAADGIKKVSMELGGHAPVLIFDDANIDELLLHAQILNLEMPVQVCISPTRFFVQENSYEKFCEIFTKNTKGLKLGNGLDKDTNVVRLQIKEV